MTDDTFKLNEEEKPFDPPPGVKPKVMKPKDAATLILVRGGRRKGAGAAAAAFDGPARRPGQGTRG